MDTLDEPVTATIVSLTNLLLSRRLTPYQARDLLSIYSKLVHVLYPRKSSGREVLRSAVPSSSVGFIIEIAAGTGISGVHYYFAYAWASC